MVSGGSTSTASRSPLISVVAMGDHTRTSRSGGRSVTAVGIDGLTWTRTWSSLIPSAPLERHARARAAGVHRVDRGGDGHAGVAAVEERDRHVEDRLVG